MYIFNPDNDLALANFTSNYTPPASAQKLGADLSLLPIWYAPDNSVVVSRSAIDAEFVASVRQRFGMSSRAIAFNEIARYHHRQIQPWGWSPLLKSQLKRAGVPDDLLPPQAQLELMREYSDRKNAVALLQELKDGESRFCGSSFHFTDIDPLLHYLSSIGGDKALKMPLSGSGRGLIWIFGEITDKQTDWARRVIKSQGGVVAEPKLERVRDFAMEFSMENGKIIFEGYSLFESAASGAYVGNVLMSDGEIENHLAAYVSTDLLHGLRQSVLGKLVDYFPHYNGVLGVDMMICNTSDGYKIQPCVEINMRMNMGMVAHRFYERFVNNQSKGHYRVDYFKKPGEAFAHHQEKSVDFPLNVENGRIESGYMSLTPVCEGTDYVAWVLVDRT